MQLFYEDVKNLLIECFCKVLHIESINLFEKSTQYQKNTPNKCIPISIIINATPYLPIISDLHGGGGGGFKPIFENFQKKGVNVKRFFLWI